MIYVTGDIHGRYGMNKLKYMDRGKLTKDDYVIIAGDFGGLWDGGYRDRKVLSWMKNRNFTTLFVDGNHENFNLLYKYPVTKWYGGKVHVINKSVIHLMRGQVYNIQGVKIFTFGGGLSIDRFLRIKDVSWWEQEEPSAEEYAEGLRNLFIHGFNVDYVITHVTPTSMLYEVEKINSVGRVATYINDYLEGVMIRLNFRKWFCGHEHIDYIFSDKFRVVYNDFIRIV